MKTHASCVISTYGMRSACCYRYHKPKCYCLGITWLHPKLRFRNITVRSFSLISHICVSVSLASIGLLWRDGLFSQDRQGAGAIKLSAVFIYFCSPYFATGKEPGAPVQIVYVPSHLYHILFELFKNAMRAVVEHHGAAARDYPPIHVLIVHGGEDVTIKVRPLPIIWVSAVVVQQMKTLISVFFNFRFQIAAVVSEGRKWATSSITCTLRRHNRRVPARIRPHWPDTVMVYHFHDCMRAICWEICLYRPARATERKLTFTWRLWVKRLTKCCPSSTTARRVTTAHLCRPVIGSAFTATHLLVLVTCRQWPTWNGTIHIDGRNCRNCWIRGKYIVWPEARVTEDIRLPPTERWIFFFFQIKNWWKEKILFKNKLWNPFKLEKNENF